MAHQQVTLVLGEIDGEEIGRARGIGSSIAHWFTLFRRGRGDRWATVLVMFNV